MKDYGKEEIEGSRPSVDVEQAVEHCYDALIADKKHRITEHIVASLTFEELLGTLLLVKDKLRDDAAQ
jgi:hypothetical protein